MKVIVGMSGGVDSSVAALLLKQQGFEVEGLFMKNWEEDDTDTYCAAASDFEDAKAVAKVLDIPLHFVNFSKEYWTHVFSHFLEEYAKGRTPNPDILCNREIKFQAFLNHAMTLGADYIATGHYAKVQNGLLYKAKDRSKDQTYFLHAVPYFALEKVLFPLGTYLKSEIREIAKAAGFLVHDKKDSTGICFIGERRFRAFLSEYLLAKPGKIYATTGELLGEHDGLMFYTLGQRQGLKIGGQKTGSGKAWYVVQKNVETNTLVVAEGAEHPMLYAQGLLSEPIHWLGDEPFDLPLTCQAKIRYRQMDEPCVISPQQNRLHCVMFANKQRAVTPGQSIVLYDKNRCLGGAVIASAIA